MPAFKKEISIDGKPYTFQINMAAMRAIEVEGGKNSGALMASVAAISMDGVSLLFWGGLHNAHAFSREEADEKLDAYGFTAALQIVQEGLTAYIGIAPAAPKTGGSADPKEVTSAS